MAMSDEQRARLLRAQLAALVRDLTGATVEAGSIGANAAVADDGTAYVLSQVADAATLAGSIAWALRQDASSLVLFTDDLGGDVARMAGYFDLPIEVRSVQGAGSVPVEPAPLPEVAPALHDPELESQLRDAGLEVVVEDGIVRGEVQGLEVARLVVWPEESGGDGLLHLEAGVGRFDRDATAAMHQGEPPTTTLARSVSTVRAERVPGRAAHPLSRLARERWLRRSLVEDPSLVGASSLEPIETTVRRDSVRDVTPAAAAGTAADGGPLVVVCSTGADLSFVPVAADTRAWRDPAARLVLAVPARDRLPTLDRLAGLLRPPATVVTVPAPWLDEDGAEGGRS
ncbi:hypothetical protein [Dermatobacter hominis]|uniref:hypothetical protein n=1 Tax=Dermatobacter hominis TaxID=2884263 RepID=UPI001D0F8EED|nr:hypothetical protein [Dermatobacter hominis]UDY37224.1 hypothetical protein LH044_06715 [Dermatobacter hominis]